MNLEEKGTGRAVWTISSGKGVKEWANPRILDSYDPLRYTSLRIEYTRVDGDSVVSCTREEAHQLSLYGYNERMTRHGYGQSPGGEWLADCVSYDIAEILLRALPIGGSNDNTST